MPGATARPADAVALAEVLPIGILLTTSGGTVRYANPALTSLFAPAPDGTPATPDATAEASVAPDATIGTLVAPSATLADLAVRKPYAPAAALWRAPDGRRQRCTLPGGRMLEGVWQPLAADRCLTVTDVTSDALIRRRLRQHNRALAELVATKTELVSALLHEVRTPLTAARSMAALLPESAGDPVVQGLERNLGRIEEVTREIATISGIENGTRVLRTVAVDLDRLLGEVVAELDPPPAVVFGVGAAPPFEGDPALLAQVFARLILAVRAVSGGDRIVAGVHDGQWRLRLPLPPDAPTDRLFTSTAGQGNATALMFARAVLGRHGGSVGIEDEHLTVRLPSGQS